MRIRDLVSCGLLLAASQAQASLVTFHATGVSGISGYVQFDDLAFDGSASQFVTNTWITDLVLDVFGETFTLADVSTGDSSILDSSGALPVIVNGAGNLADNGSMAIAFFPDGFAGPFDGDATLATGPSGNLASDNFYNVLWVAEVAAVPEPTTLALLGIGLAGLGLAKRPDATTA